MSEQLTISDWRIITPKSNMLLGFKEISFINLVNFFSSNFIIFKKFLQIFYDKFDYFCLKIQKSLKTRQILDFSSLIQGHFQQLMLHFNKHEHFTSLWIPHSLPAPVGCHSSTYPISKTKWKKGILIKLLIHLFISLFTAKAEHDKK